MHFTYELEENMKFTEFPYERIDFDKLKADFLELCEGVDKAESGEELFACIKNTISWWMM